MCGAFTRNIRVLTSQTLWTGGNSCGGRWGGSPSPCLRVTVHQGVHGELLRCSEDAALRTGLPHPPRMIRAAGAAAQRVGSSGVSKICSILITCYVHLL